jgi:hypothetical protein
MSLVNKINTYKSTLNMNYELVRGEWLHWMKININSVRSQLPKLKKQLKQSIGKRGNVNC